MGNSERISYIVAALIVASLGFTWESMAGVGASDSQGDAVAVAAVRQVSVKPTGDAGTDLPPSTSTAKSSSTTVVRVSDDIVQDVTKRMGLNIGGPEPWGAAQYLKNIVHNPGFESGEYGTMFHVAPGSTGGRVLQDFWYTGWNNDLYGIGQPEDFWAGGEFEIVFGPEKGRSGTVTGFKHEEDKYTWYLYPEGNAPQQWDVIIARKQFTHSLGSSTPSPNVDVTSKRPGSPGVQSFHATFPGADWQPVYATHFDAYWRDGDQSAGKLLQVKGDWTLEFWAKGKKNGDQLRARFYREGEGDFISHTVLLTNTWQHYTVSTNVADTADRLGPYGPADYHPLLTLNFCILNEGGEIWLDDCMLYKQGQTNPTTFTDTFVNRLKELRPGVLRDWRVQSGASLDNELAEPFARKRTGYRPHQREADNFGYSLHEFLELCKEVGAEPWYVISPTFSQEDLDNLAAYLGAPVSSGHPYAVRRQALGQYEPWTNVFEKIHLEYGNEMWGGASGSDPFFGASALGGMRLAQIAHDRFGIVQASSHFVADRIDFIIGGQSAFPGRQGEIESNSTNHDTVAVAPYFGILDEWPDDAGKYYPMFALALNGSNGVVAESEAYLEASGQGHNLAIYEINLHTTHGPAPNDMRNEYVTSLGAGLSLPLAMLSYQRDLGINVQCAFTATGYSFKFWNGPEDFVRLWGMLRDLESTGRKRPTWLGVEVANKAIQGSMITSVQEGDVPEAPLPAINGVLEAGTLPLIHSFAYKSGQGYGLVLFNLDLEQSRDVTLVLPSDPETGASVTTLTANDINATNEEALNVTTTETFLADFASTYTMTLPAHSMTALTWNGSTGISVTPDPLEFGDTLVLQKRNKEVRVKNNGLAKSGVMLLGIEPVSGDVYDFQVCSVLPQGPLMDGQESIVSIEFTPTSPGSKIAVFRVLCDDETAPCTEIVMAGRGLPDADGDGEPDSTDAFPNNPNETQDADGDGLGDNFEARIIQHAQTDGDPLNDWIVSLTDVNTYDDFDGDGSWNLMEFLANSDPTDPNKSVPLGGTWFLVLMLTVMAYLMRRTYQRVYVR